MYAGLEMKDYEAVFEKATTVWSAYCPDLHVPGVAGPNYEATERLVQEGIAFHIGGRIADGAPIPEPTNRVARTPVPA